MKDGYLRSFVSIGDLSCNDFKMVFMWQSCVNLVKYILGFLMLFFLLTSADVYSQVTDARVAEIISKVNADTLSRYVRILSGEDSVWISGKKYLLTSRRPGTATHPLTVDFIRQTLTRFGLSPVEHAFVKTQSGRNILAVQHGTDTLSKFMVCAHFDAVTDFCADDNASGTAAVLEAARLISVRKPDYSIIFAFWDQEERGLIGSSVYAAEAKTSGYNIQGVLNLDMLAWDSNADHAAEIHTRNIASSAALAQKIKNLNTEYSVGLNIQVLNPGSTASDHASFWNNGFSGILLIESFSDFNPYYHRVQDRFPILNQEYFHKMAKLAVAGIFSMASDGKSTIAGLTSKQDALLLEQNFPNPVTSNTTFRFFMPQPGDASLQLYNSTGIRVSIVLSGRLDMGQHQVTMNCSSLQPGIYFYRLRAGGESRTGNMVVVKQ